jgi:type IV secretory pathway protease TraF
MKPGAYDDTHAHVARRTRSSLVLGGLVLAAVLSTRWVRLNCSPSAPLGFYRLTAVPTPLERGTLVVLPVPPEVGAWHSRWVPLLKPVAAIAGDFVCVWEEGLWIEGQWYGPVLREADGKVLPRMDGCVHVAPREVVLASPARHSLDARYFGPVATTALTAQAVPLLTWGETHGE